VHITAQPDLCFVFVLRDVYACLFDLHAPM
jgi:hypothetical protein